MQRSTAAALLALLAALPLPAAAGTVHSVLLSAGQWRSLSLQGQLAFTEQSRGFINDVAVNPGDEVRIVIERPLAAGYLALSLHHGAHAVLRLSLPSAKAYVNGALVASGSITARLYPEPTTLSTSLTAKLDPSPSGPLLLVVDGHTVVNSASDSSSVALAGLSPSPGRLVVDLYSHYIRGGAARVEVNGVEVPATAPGALLPLVALAAAYPAYAAMARRRSGKRNREAPFPRA